MKQKTDRLRVAVAAGFPDATLILLMAEVVIAMAEEQIQNTELIVSNMRDFRGQLETLNALARALRP